MALQLITHGSESFVGKEWRSETTLLGLPLVHITQGFDANGKALKSRGIIAVGQYASGFFCFSQFGVGVICCCQFGCGLLTTAQFGMGLLGMASLASSWKGYAQYLWELLGT